MLWTRLLEKINVKLTLLWVCMVPSMKGDTSPNGAVTATSCNTAEVTDMAILFKLYKSK